ncbi:MAG: YqhV family protein [Alicyclobacillaceae bacterium]|nr:YqhV family protein [Alicyclobacillaceae bacterium]
MWEGLREHAVMAMGTLRVISGCIEVTAGLLMLYFRSLERAMAINAGLSLVGPTVLILVTATGLSAMADDLSWGRILLILAGVTFILWGIFAD